MAVTSSTVRRLNSLEIVKFLGFTCSLSWDPNHKAAELSDTALSIRVAEATGWENISEQKRPMRIENRIQHYYGV